MNTLFLRRSMMGSVASGGIPDNIILDRNGNDAYFDNLREWGTHTYNSITMPTQFVASKRMIFSLPLSCTLNNLSTRLNGRVYKFKHITNGSITFAHYPMTNTISPRTSFIVVPTVALVSACKQFVLNNWELDGNAIEPNPLRTAADFDLLPGYNDGTNNSECVPYYRAGTFTGDSPTWKYYKLTNNALEELNPNNTYTLEGFSALFREPK